jgi:hypothetical protein
VERVVSGWGTKDGPSSSDDSAYRGSAHLTVRTHPVDGLQSVIGNADSHAVQPCGFRLSRPQGFRRNPESSLVRQATGQPTPVFGLGLSQHVDHPLGSGHHPAIAASTVCETIALQMCSAPGSCLTSRRLRSDSVACGQRCRARAGSRVRQRLAMSSRTPGRKSRL